MSAFLKALENYSKGSSPKVNPPEAARVLATETAAEVDRPAASAAAESPAPTAASNQSADAPAQSSEPPKEKKTRARRAAADPATSTMVTVGSPVQGASPATGDLSGATTEQLRDELKARGYSVTLG